MLAFQKIQRALFSCNCRFEIQPFALFPTISKINGKILLYSKAYLGPFQAATMVLFSGNC